MKFVLFYHSLVSDWNHGNAHFLRGIVAELLAAGHDVQVYEPSNAWSRDNLVADHGVQAWHDFEQRFPHLRSHIYELDGFDPDRLCDGADAVIVHEWNPPELLAKLGRHRRTHRYKLLFHDTHHRCVTAPHEMARFDFRDVDGVSRSAKRCASAISTKAGARAHGRGTKRPIRAYSIRSLM